MNLFQGKKKRLMINHEPGRSEEFFTPFGNRVSLFIIQPLPDKKAQLTGGIPELYYTEAAISQVTDFFVACEFINLTQHL